MRAAANVLRGRVRLKDFSTDASDGWEKKETRARTEPYLERLAELQQLLRANSRHALLLVFQGLDASGKNGAIRNLLRKANPTGIGTTSFKQPNGEERVHDFLWRVHRCAPAYGRIGVFNRSHYEAVLAERIVDGLPERECSRRCAQIVDFERMLVENRVVILKFFLHVSRDEQAKRFHERLVKREKNWKFRPADLDTRRKWKHFIRAYEEVLGATSHAAARWHLIPADRKWYRDFLVARTTVHALEALQMKWPKLPPGVRKVRIE